MSKLCRTSFGMQKDPFSKDIAMKDLLELRNLVSVRKRLDYLLELSGVMVVTGEVGSGKSTALRWAISSYHPSEHKIVSIVATSGSSLEFYRQIAWGLGLEFTCSRLSSQIKEIKAAITDIVVNRRQKVLIAVDEANLLRPTIFTELHTLSQFEFDSKPRLSLLLCGLPSLLDRLCNRGAEPLASRIVTRTHLEPLDEPTTRDYIGHHLKICGIKKQLFTDQALTAIYQGSSGLPRRINNLCRGGLEAAVLGELDQVDAEQIRLAASELI
jgi:general secretion pathway protein A